MNRIFNYSTPIESRSSLIISNWCYSDFIISKHVFISMLSNLKIYYFSNSISIFSNKSVFDNNNWHTVCNIILLNILYFLLRFMRMIALFKDIVQILTWLELVFISYLHINAIYLMQRGFFRIVC